jgi:hypothetical protein
VARRQAWQLVNPPAGRRLERMAMSQPRKGARRLRDARPEGVALLIAEADRDRVVEVLQRCRSVRT